MNWQPSCVRIWQRYMIGSKMAITQLDTGSSSRVTPPDLGRLREEIEYTEAALSADPDAESLAAPVGEAITYGKEASTICGMIEARRRESLSQILGRIVLSNFLRRECNITQDGSLIHGRRIFGSGSESCPMALSYVSVDLASTNLPVPNRSHIASGVNATWHHFIRPQHFGQMLTSIANTCLLNNAQGFQYL